LPFLAEDEGAAGLRAARKSVTAAVGDEDVRGGIITFFSEK